MALTIKAYEHKLKPDAAVLVVTSKDYTHVIEVADYASKSAKGEKIDVDKIVEAREKILKANQKLIDDKVAKHTGSKKEIDFSNLVTVAATDPVKEGGK